MSSKSSGSACAKILISVISSLEISIKYYTTPVNITQVEFSVFHKNFTFLPDRFRHPALRSAFLRRGERSFLYPSALLCVFFLSPGKYSLCYTAFIIGMIAVFRGPSYRQRAAKPGPQKRKTHADGVASRFQRSL